MYSVFWWLICDVLFWVFIQVDKIFHPPQKNCLRGLHFSISLCSDSTFASVQEREVVVNFNIFISCSFSFYF